MSRSRRRTAPPGIVARLLPGVAVTVALYYAVWGGSVTALDLRMLAARRQEAEVRLAELRVEVDSLKELEEKLETDPATIERVAREKFGMIRDGEVMYRFAAVDTAAAP